MLAPLPGPELPVSQSDYVRGWRAVRTHAIHAGALCLGLSMLSPYLMLHWTPATGLVEIMAPLAYLVAVFPVFLGRKRPAASAAEAAPAARQT
ncbi:MAG: hypothetical protein DMG24_19770 [Acidobacteria bacterium]|nr:MAG: hypothetical protein DMG24_19770 [Acidobacteriota bacterium]